MGIHRRGDVQRGLARPSRSSGWRVLAGLSVALVNLTGCAPGPSDRAPSVLAAAADCVDRNPLRNAYFGDLHIHTRFSMDAYTGDTPATPREAYRFARGESIEIAGGRHAQLERPVRRNAADDFYHSGS